MSCDSIFESSGAIFINDTITARGEIAKIIEDKSIMMIDVSCYNQENEIVVGSMSKIKLLDIEE